LLEGTQACLRTGLEQARRAIESIREPALSDDLADVIITSARLHLALFDWVVSQGRSEEGEVHAEAALVNTTEAIELAARWPSTPESYLYTHSRALRAMGREVEADETLRRAYEQVMLVASKTRDESLRLSWLENVRINREILSAWAARREPY
jgi:hypothetical protein